MKIRSFSYYIKQGFQSINRNKMMSIASISTVMASLLILGIFFITMTNVNFMVKSVESGVEVKVFLKNDITNDQKSDIETKMKSSPGVTDVTFETKQQALENFKKQLGDNASLVDGVDAEKVMPSSYIIKMQGPQYADAVVVTLKTMAGVDKINDARSFLDKLMKVTSFVKNLGLALMAILLVVSVFLISNTIKLTVIARKREIGIMKYIGATDWFIRWPFIIEGVLLGILGALISGILLSYGYIAIVDSLTKNSYATLMKLVEPSDIIPYMSALFIGLGILIGSIGSTFSLRKFLHV